MNESLLRKLAITLCEQDGQRREFPTSEAVWVEILAGADMSFHIFDTANEIEAEMQAKFSSLCYVSLELPEIHCNDMLKGIFLLKCPGQEDKPLPFYIFPLSQQPFLELDWGTFCPTLYAGGTKTLKRLLREQAINFFRSKKQKRPRRNPN